MENDTLLIVINTFVVGVAGFFLRKWIDETAQDKKEINDKIQKQDERIRMQEIKQATLMQSLKHYGEAIIEIKDILKENKK